MKKYSLWSSVLDDYFSSDEELHKQGKQYIKYELKKYGCIGNFNYFKFYCTPIQITTLLKDIPEMIEYLI